MLSLSLPLNEVIFYIIFYIELEYSYLQQGWIIAIEHLIAGITWTSTKQNSYLP